MQEHLQIGQLPVFIQEDDISPSALSGQFIVDATGKASYSIDVVEDNKTEGTEFLKFALTYTEQNSDNSYNWSAVINVGGLTQIRW